MNLKLKNNVCFCQVRYYKDYMKEEYLADNPNIIYPIKVKIRIEAYY